MPLKFVYSRQGNIELFNNNYIYSLIKSTLGKSYISWKCIKCNITVQTTSTEPSGNIIGDENPKHPTHKPCLKDIKKHHGFAAIFRMKNKNKNKLLGNTTKMVYDDQQNNDTMSDISDASISSNSQIKTFSCETIVGKLLELNFEWKIGNFFDYWKTCQSGEVLESSRFSLLNDKSDKWYFKLFPRGNNDNPGHVLLYINLTNESIMNLPSDFLSGTIYMTITVGEYEKKPIKKMYIHQCSENNYQCIFNLSLIGFENILKQSCPSETLYIFVEIKARACVHQVYEEKFESFKWGTDNTKNYYDIVFNIAGQEFHANKYKLEESSTVFCNIFEQQLTDDNVDNIVTITDVQPKVFGQLLEFIQTNDISIVQTMPEDLLFAANKFKLDGLKKICEDAIIRKISSADAPKMFVMAHKIDDLVIKKEPIDLFQV
ncbi:hypothetical protein HCN44_005396 [Aphidius gifuensis]|uniref:BTB domain-containing protein n=1 Tax=Aphidius gifuensis TaxID=684658 RepID=A0A834Y4N0_APHGI|nr:speckle-type POZ protein-like [Aphidius gifuensis]KAF7997119.1 hypothetical protein HCN44_005396 [Aphidius gifuensis]